MPKKLEDKLVKENWRRNLAIICAAQFITMIGMAGCVPFLPIYIRSLGITDPDSANLWSGLLFAGPYCLSIVAVPFWGAAGDRYGRKPMIIRAVLGLAIVMTLMGFAQNVWELLILRLTQGAVSGFLASGLAFVSADAPADKSGYAIGSLQSSVSAGNIVGPFFGGIMSDIMGIRPVFFFVGALCFVSAVLVIILVNEDKKKIIARKSDSLSSNARFVFSRPNMRIMIILIFLCQAGLYFTNPIFPYFVESLDAPAQFLSTITGALIGVVGIMSIIMSPYWGRRGDKKDYRKTIKVSASICAGAMLLQAISPVYWFLFPLRIIIGIFFAAILPTLLASLSKCAPAENKGGLMGFASSANLAGVLTGYLTCGLVSGIAGYTVCFICSAGLLALAALIVPKANSEYASPCDRSLEFSSET